MIKKKHKFSALTRILPYFIEPLIVVTTFIVPIILSEDLFLSSKGCKITLYWITSIAILILSVVNVIYKLRTQIRNMQNKRSHDILSNLNEVFDIKAEQVRCATYRPYEKHPHNFPLHYDVHSYIRNICQKLRSTLALITNIDYAHIDVGLIYKYHNESNWKWLSGKSGTSGAKELKLFMDEPTLFHYLSHTSDIVFENDKKNCKFYLLKRRDYFFNGKGSVVGMPLTYFNDADALIDFILVITTYGSRFVESNNNHAIKDFKEILIYEVLPYYISLMQTPFGEMYLRHYIKNYKEDGSPKGTKVVVPEEQK